MTRYTQCIGHWGSSRLASVACSIIRHWCSCVQRVHTVQLYWVKQSASFWHQFHFYKCSNFIKIVSPREHECKLNSNAFTWHVSLPLFQFCSYRACSRLCLIESMSWWNENMGAQSLNVCIDVACSSTTHVSLKSIWQCSQLGEFPEALVWAIACTTAADFRIVCCAQKLWELSLALLFVAVGVLKVPCAAITASCTYGFFMWLLYYCTQCELARATTLLHAFALYLILSMMVHSACTKLKVWSSMPGNWAG